MATKPQQRTTKTASPKVSADGSAKAPRTRDAVSEDSANMLKKKEFIERCVVKSGLKKRDVKPSVEAALAVLGEALAAGEDINLQPFGKIVVKKKNEMENADVYVCRIRRAKPKPEVQ